MATGVSGGAYQKYGEQYKEIPREVRRGRSSSRRRKAPPRTSRCFATAGSTSRSSQGGSRRAAAGASTASRRSFRSARSITSRCGCSSRAGPAAGRHARGTRRKPDGGRRRGQRHALRSRCSLLHDRRREVAKGTTLLPLGGEEMLQRARCGRGRRRVPGRRRSRRPVVGASLHRRDLTPMSLAHAAAYAKRNSNLDGVDLCRRGVRRHRRATCLRGDLAARGHDRQSPGARTKSIPALLMATCCSILRVEVNMATLARLRGETRSPIRARPGPADRGGGAALLQSPESRS